MSTLNKILPVLVGKPCYIFVFFWAFEGHLCRKGCTIHRNIEVEQCEKFKICKKTNACFFCKVRQADTDENFKHFCYKRIAYYKTYAIKYARVGRICCFF